MPFRDRFFNVMWKKIHPENHHKKYDKTPQTERMKNRRSHGTEITFFSDLCRKYTVFSLVLSNSDNEKQSQTKSDKIKSAL